MKDSIKREQMEREVDVLFKDLLDRYATYNSSDPIKLKEAFLYGKHVHRNQRRLSGSYYFTHPIGVALILTEYYANEDTLVAALLHDTVEDSHDVSVEEIEEKFGKEVAYLVQGLTKVDKMLLPKEDTPNNLEFIPKQVDIETTRNMLEMAKDDLRIIIIKLADRLHNMRTLHLVPDEERRKKKALETFYIFVQIASRLSIWKMRSELEKLCFPYVHPKNSEYIQRFIKDVSYEKNRIEKKAQELLIAYDSKNLIQKIVPYERGPLALRYVLEEKKTLTVNDVTILQVVTDTEDNCFLVLKLIHTLFKTRSREYDWITMPRDNGYQAYQTDVVTDEGEIIQFRIMTREMLKRNWQGVCYDIFRKKKKLKGLDFLSRFEDLSQRTEGMTYQFYEAAATDIFEDKIEIYTKGKSVLMPYDSTVLDFMFYAFDREALRVKEIFLNHRKCSFDTKLSNGDLVTANFSDEISLEFYWLHMVKTVTAKILIQEALKKWSTEKKLELGRSILQKEFDWYNIGDSDFVLERNQERINEEYDLKNPHDVYIMLSEGRIQAYEVISVLFPNVRTGRYNIWAFCIKGLKKIFYIETWEQMRFKIEGVLDREGNLLSLIDTMRQKRDIFVVDSYLSENPDLNTFYLQMNCRAKNRKSFYHFLSVLEHKEGIVRVLPMLSRRRIIWLIFWIILAVILWGVLPTMLSLMKNYYPDSDILRFVIIEISIFPILVSNYILYRYVRNYFVQLRGSLWLIPMTILVNCMGLLVFYWQSVVVGYELNATIIMFLLISLLALFLYQYRLQAKRYSLLEK